MDGAARLEHNVGGVGVVIRDWFGKFFAIGAWRKDMIKITLHVELLIVLEGLRLASSLVLNMLWWRSIPHWLLLQS